MTRLEEVLAEFRQEADVLREWGATCQAELIERCASRIEESLLVSPEETISVEEAARLAEVSPETVRRAVRRLDIPDLRTKPKGAMRIRRADVDFLRGKRRAKHETHRAGYDPIAHARELLRAG